MKQLAPSDFHAMCQHLNEVVYTMDAADFYTHSLESSLNEALHSLRQSNVNGELDVVIQRIDRLSGKLFQIMYECIVDIEEPWAVLCHGDLWINNLMFKYDAANRCSGVRLVDLQTMRYSSPVVDILVRLRFFIHLKSCFSFPPANSEKDTVLLPVNSIRIAFPVHQY